MGNIFINFLDCEPLNRDAGTATKPKDVTRCSQVCEVIDVSLTSDSDFGGLAKAFQSLSRRNYHKVILSCCETSNRPDWSQAQECFRAMANMQPRRLHLKDLEDFPLVLLLEILMGTPGKSFQFVEKVCIHPNVSFHLDEEAAKQLANTNLHATPPEDNDHASTLSFRRDWVTIGNLHLLLDPYVGWYDLNGLTSLLEWPRLQLKRLSINAHSINSFNGQETQALAFFSAAGEVAASTVKLHVENIQFLHSQFFVNAFLSTFQNNPRVRSLHIRLLPSILSPTIPQDFHYETREKVEDALEANYSLESLSIFGMPLTRTMLFWLKLNRGGKRSQLFWNCGPKATLSDWLDAIIASLQQIDPEDKNGSIKLSSVYYFLRKYPPLVQQVSQSYDPSHL